MYCSIFIKYYFILPSAHHFLITTPLPVSTHLLSRKACATTTATFADTPVSSVPRLEPGKAIAGRVDRALVFPKCPPDRPRREDAPARHDRDRSIRSGDEGRETRTEKSARRERRGVLRTSTSGFRHSLVRSLSPSNAGKCSRTAREVKRTCFPV